MAAFDAHWEAAKSGDWETFLDGCTVGARGKQTPASAADKFENLAPRMGFTLDGFGIINRSATILSPITAYVEGNVAEYDEIAAEGYKGANLAWIWTTEDDVWVDGVCSLGGS